MNGKWIEIFRAGNNTDAIGRTKEWTLQDLDEIANKYKSNKHEFEAPIVIGHPKNTAPAYGWVEEIKRVGDTLQAKVKNVMPEFSNLVKAGTYRNRSIRVHPKYGIEHLAFLGAVRPAITGLKDVEFESCDSDYEIYINDFSNSEYSNGDELMDPKELEALKKERDDLKKTLENVKDKQSQEFSAEMEKIKTENAELKLRIQQDHKQQKKKDYAEFASSIAERIKPSNVEKVTDFLVAMEEAGDFEFSSVGKKPLVEEFKAFLQTLPEQVSLTSLPSSKTTTGYAYTEFSTGTEIDEDSAKLDKEAEEFAAQNKISYQEAVIHLVRKAGK